MPFDYKFLRPQDRQGQLLNIKYELLYNAAVNFFDRDNWTMEELFALTKKVEECEMELRAYLEGKEP